MRASTVAIRAAVIFALCGIGLGIGMAMTHNHTLQAAHAHINLVGWVSLFLFAMYYKAHPAVDTTRCALVQVGSWVFGGALLGLGVALIYGAGPQYQPFAAIGSLIVFASLLIFAYVVFRPQTLSSSVADVAPAE